MGISDFRQQAQAGGSGVPAIGPKRTTVFAQLSQALTGINDPLRDSLNRRALIEAEDRGRRAATREEFPSLSTAGTPAAQVFNNTARQTVNNRVALETETVMTELANEFSDRPELYKAAVSKYRNETVNQLEIFDPTMAQDFDGRIGLSVAKSLPAIQNRELKKRNDASKDQGIAGLEMVLDNMSSSVTTESGFLQATEDFARNLNGTNWSNEPNFDMEERQEFAERFIESSTEEFTFHQIESLFGLASDPTLPGETRQAAISQLSDMQRQAIGGNLTVTVPNIQEGTLERATLREAGIGIRKQLQIQSHIESRLAEFRPKAEDLPSKAEVLKQFEAGMSIGLSPEETFHSASLPASYRAKIAEDADLQFQIDQLQKVDDLMVTTGTFINERLNYAHQEAFDLGADLQSIAVEHMKGVATGAGNPLTPESMARVVSGMEAEFVDNQNLIKTNGAAFTRKNSTVASLAQELGGSSNPMANVVLGMKADPGKTKEKLKDYEQAAQQAWSDAGQPLETFSLLSPTEADLAAASITGNSADDLLNFQVALNQLNDASRESVFRSMGLSARGDLNLKAVFNQLDLQNSAEMGVARDVYAALDLLASPDFEERDPFRVDGGLDAALQNFRDTKLGPTFKGSQNAIEIERLVRLLAFNEGMENPGVSSQQAVDNAFARLMQTTLQAETASGDIVSLPMSSVPGMEQHQFESILSGVSASDVVQSLGLMDFPFALGNQIFPEAQQAQIRAGLADNFRLEHDPSRGGALFIIKDPNNFTLNYVQPDGQLKPIVISLPQLEQMRAKRFESLRATSDRLGGTVQPNLSLDDLKTVGEGVAFGVKELPSTVSSAASASKKAFTEAWDFYFGGGFKEAIDPFLKEEFRSEE